MKLLDFVELKNLEDLQNAFAEATGITVGIKDSDGSSITKAKAGIGADASELAEYSQPILVNGENLGSITCEALSSEKQDMSELSIKKVMSLAGTLFNSYLNVQFTQSVGSQNLKTINEEIKGATATVQTIGKKANELESIASKQNMLALNASIEAARSGEAGVGFAVVAKQMGELSKKSEVIYSDIKKSAIEITKSIEVMASALDGNKSKKY